jgi:hypothetical protein
MAIRANGDAALFWMHVHTQALSPARICSRSFDGNSTNAARVHSKSNFLVSQNSTVPHFVPSRARNAAPLTPIIIHAINCTPGLRWALYMIPGIMCYRNRILLHFRLYLCIDIFTEIYFLPKHQLW